MQIEGSYFHSGSSTPIDGVLISFAGTYEVKLADGTKERLELDHVGDRLGNIPRKIFFENGAIFETPHNNAVDEMFQLDTGFVAKLTRLESSWRMVAIIAVACIGLIYSLFTYGLPALASGAAWATPEIALVAIDKGALSSVDKVFFEESQAKAEDKEKMQKLFDEIVEVSGIDNPKPKLLFRDGGSMGANAFALPGGTVVFTDQIIDLAESDDELAGVIAHELGHVHNRHGLKQIYRVLGVGFMIGVIGGDSSQLIEEVAAQFALLQNFSYSRVFETESDVYSAGIMLKANRDPLAFIDLLDRLVGDIPGAQETGWLSSHPGNKDRRSSVAKIVEDAQK